MYRHVRAFQHFLRTFDSRFLYVFICPLFTQCLYQQNKNKKNILIKNLCLVHIPPHGGCGNNQHITNQNAQAMRDAPEKRAHTHTNIFIHDKIIEKWMRPIYFGDIVRHIERW